MNAQPCTFDKRLHCIGRFHVHISKKARAVVHIDLMNMLRAVFVPS